ncbi:hypothetical protein CKM354_001193900 [Cercospora kikuchii]|uniref:Beta-lactamase-related domain-containing protein n=1 Tax=Cercospora kikuchii TaxID=84275 RepID=A0A9P3CTZ7_9PEZI|nr:uncharacterized protein CKM354_001193900 [Cercospora kikuchii]GIZ48896.1 hypothetical protein CKM354_001193900 [Cercospora kikuchii]
MKFVLASCLTAFLATATALDEKNDLKICPIKGQQFPFPTRLSEEAVFKNATKIIEDHFKANLTMSPYNETTFSLGLFSVDESELIFEYSHTDEAVQNSTQGTRSADSDSIYRIASISKVLTVYLWMIKAGDRRWNDPITEYIPELAQLDRSQYDYAVPDWDEITVGDLASYLSGGAREYALNDLAPQGYLTDAFKPTVQDLPHVVAQKDVPTCGYLTVNVSYVTCNQKQSINGIGELAASFPPGYTPLYSNANFALLGTALANLADEDFEKVFHDSLVRPLGLTGTTSGRPNNITAKSIVPLGDAQKSSWDNDLGPQDPAAGAFSTVNDLAAIGRAILNSTLTTKAATRRWFSTMTFVEIIDQAAGRPWEIFRRKVNGHPVEIYTKSGYWGAHRSVFAVVPAYNFGFAVLTASLVGRGEVQDDVPNVVINAMLPALDEISRQQAHRNLAGQYTLNDNSNTSITITTDDLPGMKVTEYISNGFDVLHTVFGSFGTEIDFRLIPNHLYGGDKTGFTGVYQPPQKQLPDGTWYWPCQTWLDIDDFTYGNVPLGQLVFDADDTGRACNVEIKALKQKLERKQV